MASLEIKQVKKRHGTTEILCGIDIAVGSGDFLVLVGPSGCGKTTLLNMIAGLDTVSEGDILIDGRRVNDLHPSERDIAMVFQSYALYPTMTVEQNISFGMEMRKVPKDQRVIALQEVSKLLQIDHLLQRRPGQLSGGQRQRVAMGRALVRKPRIFLFDEPLSNLDAKLRVDMRTEIKKLHQRLGSTIVYVTHDQTEAMTLATRIAVMRHGVLQQIGSPAEIYHQPANMFVAGFMGSPSMNLLPARVSTDTGQPRLVLAAPAATPAELTLTTAPTAALNSEVIAGLRPEAISDRHLDVEDPNRQTVSARIVITEPTGADTLALVNIGGHELTARLSAECGFQPGDQVTLAVDLAKLVLFDPKTEVRLGSI